MPSNEMGKALGEASSINEDIKWALGYLSVKWREDEPGAARLEVTGQGW